MGTCNAFLTLSHHLQVAPDRGMKGTLVHLDFSAAYDRITHRGLFYKQRSISVGGQFLSMVSQFLSDRTQRVRLEGKVRASVNVVAGVPQASVLGPLSFILCTSELFHIVGNHIVVYADDSTIYAFNPRPLSRPEVMESLSQDLAVNNSWCF